MTLQDRDAGRPRKRGRAARRWRLALLAGCIAVIGVYCAVDRQPDLPDIDPVLAYTPDRSYFVTGSLLGEEITLVHRQTGHRVQSFHVDNHPSFVQFSPDGRYLLVVSLTDKAWLWDRVSGRSILALTDLSWMVAPEDLKSGGFPVAARFSPKGGYLTTWHHVPGDPFGPPVVSIWEVTTGTHVLDVPTLQVSFDDSEQAVAVHGDLGTDTWNLRTGQHRFAPSVSAQPRLVEDLGHANGATRVAFLPDDGQLVTGGDDGTIRVWSREGHELMQLFESDQGWGPRLNQLEVSPDGRLIVTAGTSGIVLWDRATRSALHRWPSASTAAFGAGGTQLLLGEGPLVYDIAGAGVVRYLGSRRASSAVAYSPRRQLAIVGDHPVEVFRIDSGAPVAWLNARELQSSQIAVSADDQTILVFDADKVSRHTVDSGAVLWSTPLPGALQDREVAWVTGGDLFVTGSSVYVSSWSIGQVSIFGSTKFTPARLWEVSDGREITWLRTLNVPFHNVVVPPIRDQLLILGDDSMQLRDARTGAVVTRFETKDLAVHDVVFSRDGRYLAAPAGSRGMVWDVRTGRAVRAAEQPADAKVSAIALSRNELTLALVVGRDVAIWDTKLGRESARISEHEDVEALAVSFDGAQIAVQAGRSIDIHSRSGLRRQAIPAASSGEVSFSPDGHFLYSNSSSPLCWDLVRRRPCVEPQGSRTDPMAFSPGSERVAASPIWSKYVDIFDANTRRRLHRIQLPAELWQVWLAPRDGQRVGVKLDLASEKVQWYDVATGKHVAETSEADADQQAADDSDRRTLQERVQLSADDRGGVSLVTVDDHRVIGHLRSFPGGAWAVTDSEGRFDTDLDRAAEMFWQMDSKPQLLPLEVYLRDYFEPRLLPRLLAGELLPPAVPVDHLSTVRPQLQIAAVEAVARDVVEVTLNIAPDPSAGPQGSLHDVRVFRNGQLVARHPAPDPARVAACQKLQSLARWRCETAIPRDQWTQPIRVRSRIAITDAAAEIEFSAYGFNEDRVKTATARARFQRPRDWLRPPRQTARLLAIGVASNANLLHFGLTHPEKDARDFAAAVSAHLADFPGERDLGLLTDANGPAAVAGPPTKSAIRAQLESLAARTSPEDLVVVYFSGHGVRDRNGAFYLIPADMPAGDPAVDLDAMLASAISSTELASWLSAIDAGQLVLIIDACHSGALTGGAAFKPGPMGEATFGQLAYDKSMQVLSATQPQALATTATRAHSLLTDVLLRDCFPGGTSVPQGRISLTRALQCAVDQVPQRQSAERDATAADDTQVPSLFDYGHRQVEAWLR